MFLFVRQYLIQSIQWPLDKWMNEHKFSLLQKLIQIIFLSIRKKYWKLVKTDYILAQHWAHRELWCWPLLCCCHWCYCHQWGIHRWCLSKWAKKAANQYTYTCYNHVHTLHTHAQSLKSIMRFDFKVKWLIVAFC